MLSQEAIIKYSNWKAIKYARAAISYSSLIQLFFKKVNKPLEEVDNDDIIAFQLDLKTKETATQSLYAAALRDFFTFTNGRGWTNLNIKEIEVPRVVEKVPVYVVQSEFEKLCATCDTDIKLLALRLLWFTGIRVSELCDIKIEQLDLTQRSAYIHTRKSFRPKLISWDDETNDLLLLILSEQKGEYIFQSPKGGKLSCRQIQRWIEDLRHKAGITKEITPHSFRHGFTKEMLNLNVDIPAIQEMLGHKNPASIFKYTKRLDDDIREKAREALRKRVASLKFKEIHKLT